MINIAKHIGSFKRYDTNGKVIEYSKTTIILSPEQARTVKFIFDSYIKRKKN